MIEVDSNMYSEQLYLRISRLPKAGCVQKIADAEYVEQRFDLPPKAENLKWLAECQFPRSAFYGFRPSDELITFASLEHQ